MAATTTTNLSPLSPPPLDTTTSKPFSFSPSKLLFPKPSLSHKPNFTLFSKNPIFDPHFTDPLDNFSKTSIFEPHPTNPVDNFSKNSIFEPHLTNPDDNLSKNPIFEPKTPIFEHNFSNPDQDFSKDSNFKANFTGPDGDFEYNDDKPREECGVVGIFADPEASRLCYLALHALQHRGQEGAGIVTVNDKVLHSVTGVGLVSEVFNQSKLDQLPGDSAIGHVRYSTAGSSMLKNVQPFVTRYRYGSVGVAHNGNLVNYQKLRNELEDNGSIFTTSSDTEVVLHLIAISKARPFFLRIVEACGKLEGAYSMVFLTEEKLVAVRDPYGFRPLVMGRKSNGAVVFASETCALDLIEATYEREVNPGEVIVVDKTGVQSSLCLLTHVVRKACIFEHIYFALPNSIVFGRSVYASRHKYGEILATEAPVECDVVIAVPDSGVVAALGYAAKSGVPFQQGLIRSHYVGRTFIEPSQKIRDFGVKLKLSPVRAVLEGKRVVVVDDSIVRGTTSSKIVRLLKEAGAKEVHMRIASPPIIGSCYYGVDTPSAEELISNRLSVEGIRDYIGSDSLAFLPIESMQEFLGDDSPNFCYACFSGKYPVLPTGKVKHIGDSVDDGLSGSMEYIDGGWIQETKDDNGKNTSPVPEKDEVVA